MQNKKEQYSLSVQGKNIVITGALGFLGQHIVHAFKTNGAKIVAIDTADEKVALEKFQIANDGGSGLTYYSCDITDKKQLLAVQTDLKKKFEHIDVLVNAAAINPAVENSSLNKDDPNGCVETLWDETMRVNVLGTLMCSKTFFPLFKEGSSVINISSIYSLVAPDQNIYNSGERKPSAYGSSKAALNSLTQYLGVEWAKAGVRVNAVVLGGVFNNQPEQFVTKYSARVPMGRMAMPEEAVGCILFLASDASSYATGSLFVIDGGLSAW